MIALEAVKTVWMSDEKSPSRTTGLIVLISPVEDDVIL